MKRIITITAILSVLTLTYSCKKVNIKINGDGVDKISCITKNHLLKIDAENEDLFTTDSTGTSSNTMLVNPENILQIFAHTSLPMALGYNRINKARTSLSISKMQFFPKIGLPFTTNFPGMAISAVQFFFPFLLPATWADYYQNKMMLIVEELGFQLLGIEYYNSLLNIYEEILNGKNMNKFLVQNYNSFIEIERIVRESYEMGIASDNDLRKARASVLTSYQDLLDAQKMLSELISNFRSSMGLCDDIQFDFKQNVIEPVPAEYLNINEAMDRVMAKSLEAMQLDTLLKAAKGTKWAKYFVFLGDAYVTTSNVWSQGTGFSFLNQTGGLNLVLDAAAYRSIKVVSDQIKELKLRRMELKLELKSALEKVLNGISITKDKIDGYKQIVGYNQLILNDEIQSFKDGEKDLSHVITARNNLRQSELMLSQAETNLRVLRSTLNRMLVEDRYSNVPSCGNYELVDDNGKKIWHYTKFKNKDSFCTENLVKRRLLGDETIYDVEERK